MAHFDILCVDPESPWDEVLFRNVPSNRLYQNDSGETRYRQDERHPDVEVITEILVPQDDQ